MRQVAPGVRVHQSALIQNNSVVAQGPTGVLVVVAGEVDVVVPGHGSVGGADEFRARIDLDRAYVQALRDGTEVDDPRIGAFARPGWEWVTDVHAWQVQRLGERNLLGSPTPGG